MHKPHTFKIYFTSKSKQSKLKNLLLQAFQCLYTPFFPRLKLHARPYSTS